MLPASDVLPSTRGWAASPDLLLVLVDLMITERPSLVVECGSGASTLWLALAMRRFKIDGRIVALDHDPVSAARPASSWPGMTSATWLRCVTPHWRASASMARPTRGTPAGHGKT